MKAEEKDDNNDASIGSVVIITLSKISLTIIPALIGSGCVRVMTTVEIGLLNGYLEAGLGLRDDKGGECEEEIDDSCLRVKSKVVIE